MSDENISYTIDDNFKKWFPKKVVDGPDETGILHVESWFIKNNPFREKSFCFCQFWFFRQRVVTKINCFCRFQGFRATLEKKKLHVFVYLKNKQIRQGRNFCLANVFHWQRNGWSVLKKKLSTTRYQKPEKNSASRT